MSTGRRPAGKVSAKPKKPGGSKVAVFALWSKDKGGYSLSFDRGKDGTTTVELWVNGDRVLLGKEGTHYLDLYFADEHVIDRRGDPDAASNGSQRSQRPASSEQRDPNPPPADESWPSDEDIPF